MRSTPLCLLLLGVFATAACGQQRPRTGPLVPSGGPVFEVENPDFPTPMDTPLKAVFELRDAAPSAEGGQPQINTMARYLNMHAKHGVPSENLHVAGVVHAGAVWAVVNDERYREEHGTDNPNKDVVAEILASGGQLVLCGQSAAARGVDREDLLPGVQLALSAMTALTVFQQDGYQIILW